MTDALIGAVEQLGWNRWAVMAVLIALGKF